MSSATAAVQPNAPAPSVSSRQYRDQYYPQQSSASTAAAQSSTRRVRQPSNGNSPQTPTQHYSPAESSTSTMTTPRALPLPPSTNNSPTVPMTATTSASGPPFPPPPRTSSSQRGQTATADADSSSSHSRRKPVQTGTSSSSRSKPSSSHDRSADRPPMGTDLPREDSIVVNRIVVDDPSVDIKRQQERVAESRPMHAATDGPPTEQLTGLSLVGNEGVDDGGRGSSRTRQEKSSRHKETRFGEYILGQTLGEGEFGKVKMGWKREGGVQVAIKLIRRETLGSNPSRLPKIYREIAILRGLQHPNIVKLHEMVETERHIGIILEYASGGELFDYILQHRFLKDNAARRLFAQLVSGVGYLHKKGIVHRDLKLENLLLDRNRNIIITDFGFANTFNSNDELGEEIEYNLGNRDYVKKAGLDILREDGHRRGDLMQTSCGSPCYAAPELVVSDSLYTGRKVDVWSCGVILYAMLAGYLPFDDDPANPEGDNINLLYKYIVSTPLTFPEYVTPHARDLLKRILVPDPRKRADLFEVARHSWLSEYAHVVGFITSSTTTSNDIANTTVPSADAYEPPHLARSASVREPSKMNPPVTSLGGLTQKQGQIDQPEKQKTSRDTKRRTVQVEYVAPQSSTVRGDGGASTSAAAAAAAAQAKTRARSESQGPVEVSGTDGYHSQRQRTAAAPVSMAPPIRPGRDQQRAASENVQSPGAAPVTSSARPSTGGSMSASSRLPSRGNSYGQPAVAVAKDQAQGRFSQPRGKQYSGTSPAGLAEGGMYPQSASQRESGQYSQEQEQAPRPQRDSYQGRGHKRSSTISELSGKLFGKRGSIFEGKTTSDAAKPEKKSHPPVSMTRPIPNDVEPRRSTDSRRTSFSFSRKDRSGTKEQDNAGNRTSRRFSFIPSALSNFNSNRSSQQYPPGSSDSLDQRQPSRSRADSRSRMGFGRGDSRSPSRSTTASHQQYDRPRDSPPQRHHQSQAQAAPAKSRYSSQPQQQPQDTYLSTDNTHFASQPSSNGEYYRNVSQPAPSRHEQYEEENHQPQYPAGFNLYEDEYAPTRREKNVLQKAHRKFPDGYEKEGGTSGRAQRVMDFFRNRGKARNGE